MKSSNSFNIFPVYNQTNKNNKEIASINKNTNLFNNKQNVINNITTKLKEDTIKVCVRVRPLLNHEDVEFWKPDLENNVLTTVE